MCLLAKYKSLAPPRTRKAHKINPTPGKRIGVGLIRIGCTKINYPPPTLFQEEQPKLFSKMGGGFRMHDPTGVNPYLFNRQGHTPFDSMDSLDKLELQLIKEDEEQVDVDNTK